MTDITPEDLGFIINHAGMQVAIEHIHAEMGRVAMLYADKKSAILQAEIDGLRAALEMIEYFDPKSESGNFARAILNRRNT